MRRLLLVLLVGLLWTAPARSQGQLIPTAPDLGPLRLARQQVTVTVDEQVATTRVVQTFHNDTQRDLEATYIFPVPQGASIKKFTLWVDGKETAGELVEANKAREIYTDIVRRTQDPGLLEYVESSLVRVRVFPVPARGEQKLAVAYTHVTNNDGGVIEYNCPLRTGKNGAGLEHFAFEAELKSQRSLHNIYSPSHAVTITHQGERQATVRYESNQPQLDRDLQLYWSAGQGDVGLNALFHRPSKSDPGQFLLLISPRAELAQQQMQPRDMVFVLDTSGSMQGQRIQQARSALKFCLRQLSSKDRFAVLHFATSVNRWQERLVAAQPKQIQQATRWVERLEAVGSTNINDALLAALDLRSSDPNRTFTVVFFTDGLPTISEVDPQKILHNVTARNSSQTRIFTFGVGDDVNTVLLDQLADQTRSVCTYVRESEDIENKVSNLYSKISHPVLTNLKLTLGEGVRISDIYPPQLPDLFHGSQLVVLGRYTGKGKIPITLTGSIEGESKEFVYETRFPGHTNDDRAFVENLWARRKVGYLLDQIRTKGSNRELVEEVTTLAKKHGIPTPYTSYLVVPDTTPVASNVLTPYYQNHGYQPQTPPVYMPAPVAQGPAASTVPPPPPALVPPASGRIQYAPVFTSPGMTWAAPGNGAPVAVPVPVTPATPVTVAAVITPPGSVPLPEAPERLRKRGSAAPTSRGFVDIDGSLSSGPAVCVTGNCATGSSAVDLAQALQALRDQQQTTATTKRTAGRTLVRVGSVWIDEGFDGKQTAVKIRALSKAYFRILERQPHMREVFQLGTQIVLVTPCGSALLISSTEGVEEMPDAEIERLFAVRK